MEYTNLYKPPQTKKIKSGKVILYPGESVGEHKTEKKEEVIFITKGTATITEEGIANIVREGESYFVKENTIHNVKNASETPLEYVYVVGFLD